MSERTALSFASSRGFTPIVRLLLERGADPTIANRVGWTPLMAASYGAYLQVSSKVSDGGRYVETVRCLLDHPSVAATINRRHEGGQTVLWSACHRGQADVMRALLEKGADPTIANEWGYTPLAVAKRHRSRACLEALEVSFVPFPTPSPADPT
jgi:uncharacterized protein